MTVVGLPWKYLVKTIERIYILNVLIPVKSQVSAIMKQSKNIIATRGTAHHALKCVGSHSPADMHAKLSVMMELPVLPAMKW